jgi:hypothetical protein
MVESSGLYLAMARDCVALARRARSQELRLSLLQSAQSWQRLAETTVGSGDEPGSSASQAALRARSPET